MGKLYTIDEDLKSYSLITVLCRPMLEQLALPTSMAIDLIKKGKNIAYFTFSYDSITVHRHIRESYKDDKDFTSNDNLGNIAIIDINQIGEKSVGEFIKDRVDEITKDFHLDCIFVDLNFVGSYHESHEISETLRSIAIHKGVTVVNVVQTNKRSLYKKIKLSHVSYGFNSFLEASDLVLALDKRESQSIFMRTLKKFINFLLFWKKIDNFDIISLKDRYRILPNKISVYLDYEKGKFK